MAVPLQKCDHEPMELDGLFFQLLWELLGQSCLSAKADGMVLFSSLVPTQGGFEVWITAQLLRF